MFQNKTKPLFHASHFVPPMESVFTIFCVFFSYFGLLWLLNQEFKDALKSFLKLKIIFSN